MFDSFPSPLLEKQIEQPEGADRINNTVKDPIAFYPEDSIRAERDVRALQECHPLFYSITASRR